MSCDTRLPTPRIRSRGRASRVPNGHVMGGHSSAGSRPSSPPTAVLRGAMPGRALAFSRGVRPEVAQLAGAARVSESAALWISSAECPLESVATALRLIANPSPRPVMLQPAGVRPGVQQRRPAHAAQPCIGQCRSLFSGLPGACANGRARAIQFPFIAAGPSTGWTQARSNSPNSDGFGCARDDVTRART